VHVWFISDRVVATNGCNQYTGNYLTGEWEVDIPGGEDDAAFKLQGRAGAG
jgi:hypothetical protein